MSIDNEQWSYDDDDGSGPGGGQEPGRRGLYWGIGITVALLSLVIGFVIGGNRGVDTRDAAQVTDASASETTEPSETVETSAASPGSKSAPTEASSAAPSASVSPSASSSASAAGAVLAAVNPNGDVVLIDAETAAVGPTLVPNDAASTAAADTIELSWHAASGTVYVARGCSVVRHSVAEGVTKPVAKARLAAVSPDGTQLAVWACGDGEGDVGRLAVLDASTGTEILAVPLTTSTTEQGGNMNSIGGIDWRPDGKALVVTEGWEGADAQHLIDLRKLPKSVVAAGLLPVKGVEGTYHAAEYVGSRLVLSGTCCHPDEESGHVALRDGKTGTLSLLPALSNQGFLEPKADMKGRLRYIKRATSGAAGPLWALDDLKGAAREIGGSFLSVDW